MSQLVEEGGGWEIDQVEFGHFCNFCFGSSKRVSSPEGRLRGSNSGSVQSTIRKQSIVTATAKARHKPSKISFVFL